MVARDHRDTTGANTASVNLPGGTQSIQRAVAVLRILATARESGLGLTEISMQAELTRPTTHRILSVLVAEGIVEHVGEIGDTGFFTRRAGLDTVCLARQLGTYPIQVLAWDVDIAALFQVRS